jgi:hypothetical protein
MRENLTMNPYMPGAKDPYTFPGGKAQKYHSSNRVEIKKLEKATEFGYKARFKSVKTSFTKPFMEVDTFFAWDTGFVTDVDLLSAALHKGLITKEGAGYFMDGQKIAHGETKMRELLKEEAFSEKVRAALV